MSAIAGSPSYQCYLNSETYLSSGGSQQLPAVAGAGQGQNAGDHPTANSAFVANYLDTEIGHQIVLQVADARQVMVTPQQLADARATLSRADLLGHVRDPADLGGAEPALQLHRHGPALDRPGGARHHAVLVRRRGGAIRRHRRRPRGGPGRRRLQPVRAGGAITRGIRASSTRGASRPRSSRARARRSRRPTRRRSGPPSPRWRAGPRTAGRSRATC